MNKSLLQSFFVGATLVAIGICGYWLLFTQFMIYDDEGYVLWSLRSYFAEGGLYTQVYSQYGPFIYVLYHTIHQLFGLAFDNETGRWLSLFYWTASSGLAGLFVWRQTRSVIACASTIVITFASLLVMTSEPIHPGGILVFMSALGAVLGAIAIEQHRPKLLLSLCGVIGAAMMLTKINVGAFFLIATVSWLAMNLPHPRLVRAFRWLTAVSAILIPFWLMQALWPAPWIAIYALAFSLSALSLLLLMGKQRECLINFRQWPVLIGSALALSLLVLGLVWARGTSLSELWRGVVIAPLKQPLVYSNAVKWPSLLPGLCVGLILLALYRYRRQPSWIALLIVVARFGLAAGYAVQTYWGDELILTTYPFIYGLAFIWIMVVPLGENQPGPVQNSRLWVAWIFLWQTLQAYPVAGSQMSWGAFLWVPLAVIGCFEAIQFCATQARRYHRTIRVIGAAAALLYSSVLLGRLSYVGHARYTTCEPLGLKGAESLHLTDNITATFRILNKNIRRHGGMLFSYPGMFSYNIWTEHSTPTSANVTHWWSLLDDGQQQAIIDQLELDDRAVVVAQRFLIDFLVEHGHQPRGILLRYLDENFRSVIRIDTFELWVRKDRTIAPISTAKLHPGDTNTPDEIELVTDTTGIAATIEIRGLFYPHNRVASFSVSPIAPWKTTPINPDNTAAADTILALQPMHLNGLTRIAFSLRILRPLPSLESLEIVILSPDGHLLDTILFTH